MTRKSFLLLACSVACAALLGLAGLAAAAEPASSFDALRQRVVEMAKQKAAEKPAAIAADRKKRDVELPTETVLKDRSAPSAEDNPKVAPGKVQWHPTFAAASAVAAKSGKPVLLFQMMGKLDDQFC